MWIVRTIFGVIAVSIALAPSSSAQDTELKELAASLTSKIKEKGKGPVAITMFANADYGPAFSNFVVDRLIVLLSNGNNDFDIIARDRVDAAFKEISLAPAKSYDPTTFDRIGKQLGARSLIRGSYAVLPEAAVVSIVAQIVDVRTGRIIGGDVAEVRYTGDIKAMLTPRNVSPTGSSVSNGMTAPPPGRGVFIYDDGGYLPLEHSIAKVVGAMATVDGAPPHIRVKAGKTMIFLWPEGQILDLYKTWVSGTTRAVVLNRDKPLPLRRGTSDGQRIWKTVTTLDPGEYLLTPQGSNDVFCFAVDR